jgi:hypothetical protein
MPPISQTGIVEPLTVATRHNPTVDPARVATSILTGISFARRATPVADGGVTTRSGFVFAAIASGSINTAASGRRRRRSGTAVAAAVHSSGRSPSSSRWASRPAGSSYTR